MFDGGGIRVRPRLSGDATATPAAFDAHAAWSVKNYKSADATLKLPAFADGA